MRQAIGKGLLKTISKMGISTIQSYCGAQIFEAVGLNRTVIDRYFTGTASRIGGIGLDVIGQEALARHARAYAPAAHRDGNPLPVGGIYAWRRDGERHMWNPDTISLLQHSVRHGGAATYAQYARIANDDATRRATLRGLLEIRSDQKPISIDEVEPWTAIVRRFSTGAMSLGALSREAHENLAIAMNRIGGKSNTGEGGEDPARHHDERRSAIKQVASGRFGVTIDYSSTPMRSRSRWPRAQSPARAASYPASRSTSTSA